MATWLSRLARRFGKVSQGQRGRAPRKRRAPLGAPALELLETRLAPAISVSPLSLTSSTSSITFTGNANGDSLYLNETAGHKLIYDLYGPNDTANQVTTSVSTLNGLTITVDLAGADGSSVSTLTFGSRWSFNAGVSYSGNSGNANVLVGPNNGSANTWRLGGFASGDIHSNAVTFSNVGTLQGNGSDTLEGETSGGTWSLDYGSSGSQTYADNTGSVTFSGMSTLLGRDDGSNALNTFDLTADAGQSPSLTIQGGTGSNTFSVANDISLSGVTIDGGGGDTGAVATLNYTSTYSYGLVTIQLANRNTTDTPAHGYDGSDQGGGLTFTGIDAITSNTGDGADQIDGVSNLYGTWHVNASCTYATTVSGNTVTLDFSGFNYLQGGDSGNHFFVDGATSDYVLGGLGTDTLDFSTYSSGVTVGLSYSDSSYGLSGAVGAGVLGSGGFGFSAINTVIGHSGSTLNGNNSVATSTWGLGTTNTYNDGTATLTFSAFATVADFSTTSATFTVNGVTDVTTADGNAVANTFDVTADNTGTLTLNGGAGSDTLDYTGYTGGALTVILNGSTNGYASGSATGLAGFSAIDTIVGAGNAADTLEGEALGSGSSTWTLTTTNTYTDNAGNGSLTFSHFATVADAGTTQDLFTISGGTDVTEADANGGGDTFAVDAANANLTLKGGAGSDTLTYAGYAVGTAVAVTLSGSGPHGYSSTSATGIAQFTNIDVLTGHANVSTASTPDTLTGEPLSSGSSAWALTTTNTYGDGGGSTLDFTHFATVTDSGSTADTFTISGATDVTEADANGGGDTFAVDAANANLTLKGGAGSDTLTYAGYAVGSQVTVTLTGSASSGYGGSGTGIAGFTKIDDVIGHANVSTAASPDTITGEALSSGSSTWTLTGTNTYGDGSGRTVSFNHFATVDDAGTTQDLFSISGATDVATANANGAGDTFQVDAANAGLTLNGGTGSDTLTYAGYAVGSQVTVTLSGSANGYASTNATGLAGFSAIDVLVGHANVSTAASPDTLTGEALASGSSTWALGSTNHYTDNAGNGTLTFSHFATVADAGSTADLFTISGATDVTTADANGGGDTFAVDVTNAGLTLNGGAGSDTLTYAGYARGTQVAVLLTGSAGGGYGGSGTGIAGFSKIDDVIGHANVSTAAGLDTIVGEALASGSGTWTLTTTNTYTDNSGNGTVSFNHFATVGDAGSTADLFTISGATDVATANGNTGGDTFQVDAANAHLTLNGGPGSDTLTYAGYAVGTQVTVTLNGSATNGYSGTGTGIASFTEIDDVIGHANVSTAASPDTITGESVSSGSNTWTLTGTNTYGDGGSHGTVSFTHFATVVDVGTTPDTFTISGATDVTTADANGGGDTFQVDADNAGLTLNGGAGTDVVTYAGYAVGSQVTVALTGSASGGYGGTGTGLAGFSKIDDVIGHANVSTAASPDTIAGEALGSGSNTWVLTATNTYGDGSGRTVSFNHFATVADAGTTADTFTISGATDVTTADANGGGDTFQVDADNTGNLTLNGGAGSDVVTYAGYAVGTAISVTLSGSGSHGYSSTGATGLAGFTNIDDVIGHEGVSTAASPDTLTGETVASGSNTWVLGTTNTYNDGAGNGTITFSAFKAVADSGSSADLFTISGSTDVKIATANGGGDTFAVDAANAGLTLNGGAGTDVVTYAGYAVGSQVTVTLSGSASGGYGGSGTGIAGFTKIDDVIGHANVSTAAGPDTLTGEALSSGSGTWTLTGTNTYGDGGPHGTVSFTHFATVDDAGTTQDLFTVSGVTDVATANANGAGDIFDVTADNTGTLTLNGGAGSDTLDYTGYTGGALTVVLNGSSHGYSSASATGLAGFSAIDALVGAGNANDTLKGEALSSGSSAWALGATNTYSDGGSSTLTFSHFKVVTDQGSTADTFTITAGTTVATANANSGGDTFDVNGANAGLTLNGGSGSDTLSYAGYGSPPVTVTLTGSGPNGYIGSGTGLAGFTAIDDLIGSGNASDALNGETTPTTISTWALGATNTYKDGGSKTLTFSHFTLVTDQGTTQDVFNISGTTDVATATANGAGDTFNVSAASTGLTIHGGAGSDTLSYASYGSPPVTVTLSGSGGNGYNGSATGLAAFTNIDVVTGSNNAGDTLKGEALSSGSSAWTLAATNTYGDGGSKTLTFSHFKVVTDQGSTADTFNVSGVTDVATANANTGGDTFDVTADNTGTLTLNGNTGTDKLDFTGYTGGALTVVLNGSSHGYGSASATGLAGFSAIDTIVGAGNNADTLKGEALSSGSSSWTLAASNQYGDGGSSTLAFTHFGIVTDRGSTADTFTINGATTVNTTNANSGGDAFLLDTANAGLTLNGGSGSDTLSYAGYGSPPVTVTLTGSGANGYGSTSATGLAAFTAIDDLIGSGNAGDVLTGENVSSTWALGSTLTYNDGGTPNLTFSQFSTLHGGNGGDLFEVTASNTLNLVGGSGADTFRFPVTNVTLTGTVNGGGGSNTLSYAAFGSYSGYTSGAEVDLYASDATGVSGNISNVGTYVGGPNANNTLDGPLGTGTGNVWNVTSNNGGTVVNNGSTVATFSAFQNLVGAPGGNTFKFSNGVGVSGSVTGGATSDKLDFSASSNAVTFKIGTNASGGATVNNAGSVSSTGVSVNFSTIGNLTGGSGGTTFKMAAGKTISGNLNGGSGNGNELDYSAYTTSVRVTLSSGAATGVGGTVSNVNVVHGGAGNDILIGDGNNDTLIGGGGNDVLVGRGGNCDLVVSQNGNGSWGNNILIGGNGVGSSGHATLHGGNGQDILIAGTSGYDTNITALSALMAEWGNSSETFLTRVYHLSGRLSGGRNGTTYLTSVQKSNGLNTLLGGTGSHAALDWFFYSTGDAITNTNSNSWKTLL